MKKILITGGNGQIATAIKHHANAQDYLLIPHSSTELNITQTQSIEDAISHLKPDVIINTAAYTAVDQAEIETNQATEVNEQGAKQLAVACAKHRIPLIHLSTDYIFDGNTNTPYREDDQANPINYYGKSKWLGEEAIREYAGEYCILRVSGVFSEFGHNFLKTILRLAREKTELRIVADQITCPTYAGDIASALFALIKNKATSTYHFCNKHEVTWHEFATAIIEQAKNHHHLEIQNIIPITTSEYPTKAKRPRYSVLDCTKIENDIGITQPSWEKGVYQALKGLST
jgi:dTDP-4-dehydrorhamnose reductase